MTTFLLTMFLIIPKKYEIIFDTKSLVVEAERFEYLDYIPLKPLAEFLEINYVWNAANQMLHLTTGEHELVMIGNISTVRRDATFQNLPFAPLYARDDIYLPALGLIPTVGSAFGCLLFVNELKEIPSINGISIYARGDSTVLKFDWPEPLDFDVRLSLNKAIVEVDGQYKDSVKVQTALVKSLKLHSYSTYTELEFEVKKANAFFERASEVVFYNKITKKVSLIVVDPGHGGIDPGAVGKKGLYEKDVNLDLVKMLSKLIKDSLKIDVLSTREKDTYLALNERTNIANRNGADLFLSIHCNASNKDKNCQGFETFFLSEAKTDEARAAAALENAALKFDGIEPNDEIGFILYDLAQSIFLEESNWFAEFIQSSAEKRLATPARGVSQANFYVLRGAFMPAVLIETAFISNPQEEKLLRQKDFRKKVAYAIFLGIKKYISDYERRLNN